MNQPAKLTIEQKADKATIPKLFDGYTCKYIPEKGWTYNKVRINKAKKVIDILARPSTPAVDIDELLHQIV